MPPISLKVRVISSTHVSSNDRNKLPTASQFRCWYNLCNNVVVPSDGCTTVNGEIRAFGVNTKGLNTDSLGFGVAVNQWHDTPFDDSWDTWLDWGDWSLSTVRRVLNMLITLNFESPLGSVPGQVVEVDWIHVANACWKLNSPLPSHKARSCAVCCKFSELLSIFVVMEKPWGICRKPSVNLKLDAARKICSEEHLTRYYLGRPIFTSYIQNPYFLTITYYEAIFRHVGLITWMIFFDKISYFIYCIGSRCTCFQCHS